jgi:hypothetical protein
MKVVGRYTPSRNTKGYAVAGEEGGFSLNLKLLPGSLASHFFEFGLVRSRRTLAQCLGTRQSLLGQIGLP